MSRMISSDLMYFIFFQPKQGNHATKHNGLLGAKDNVKILRETPFQETRYKPLFLVNCFERCVNRETGEHIYSYFLMIVTYFLLQQANVYWLCIFTSVIFHLFLFSLTLCSSVLLFTFSVIQDLTFSIPFFPICFFSLSNIFQISNICTGDHTDGNIF